MPDEQEQGESFPIEAAKLRVPVELDTREADRQAEEFTTKLREGIKEAVKTGLNLDDFTKSVETALGEGIKEAVKTGLNLDDFAENVKAKLGEALRAAMEEATKTKIEVTKEGGDGKAGEATLRDNPLVEAIRQNTDTVAGMIKRLDVIIEILESKP